MNAFCGLYLVSGVNGIMRIYACGSIYEDIFLSEAGVHSTAYRLKRAFIGLFTQFLLCCSVNHVRLEKLR